MILKINGVVMPSPLEDGFTPKEEKIWSKNAGRNNKCKSIGTILGIKKTIEIKFPNLSYKEVAKINNEVSNVSKPYVSVYYDSQMGDGMVFDGMCYFDSVATPVMGFRNGETIIKGYTLTAIEQ